MTKKGFFMPVGLAIAALLITAVPFFIYREVFFDLPWWSAVVTTSSALAVLSIVADICYAPAPRGYRVYWNQRLMNISYGNMYPVVLKRMTIEGNWARVRFTLVDGEVLLEDLTNREAVIANKDNGLVQLRSGNFIVTKLPKRFRVTWSSEAWIEDKEESL